MLKDSTVSTVLPIIGVLKDLVLYGQRVVVAAEAAAGLAAPTRQRYTASRPAASTTFATSRPRAARE
jgi:hypothetical protein